jgi:hypothetical protein
MKQLLHQQQVAKEHVLQMLYLNQKAADPSLAIRMNQIEAFTQNAIATGRIVNGEIQIPVV